MLKYLDFAVTFSEFPDEIALCVNITNCPNNCRGCSEPWLAKDIGKYLTNEELQSLLSSHKDCTVFGLMGGDSDHEDVKRIADYIHSNSNMKVGMYSGQDYIDKTLTPYLDLYKVGRWDRNKGPIQVKGSNQIYYEKIDNELVDKTDKFRRQAVSNISRKIID